jgi:hypothetical protein
MRFAPLLMAVAGFYVFITYCNEQATTLIYLFTLIVLTFYVKDTYRIANYTALQARLSWTFHLFNNFSSRIDALKNFLQGKNKEPWEVHKDDMMNWFYVFSKLFSTKKGQLYIKDQEDLFKKLSLKKECGEHVEDDMINFLITLKKELQWKIIDLT